MSGNPEGWGVIYTPLTGAQAAVAFIFGAMAFYYLQHLKEKKSSSR